VQAICKGPLLPTISTLRTLLSARASRDRWVMSVFCRGGSQGAVDTSEGCRYLTNSMITLKYFELTAPASVTTGGSDINEQLRRGSEWSHEATDTHPFT